MLTSRALFRPVLGTLVLWLAGAQIALVHAATAAPANRPDPATLPRPSSGPVPDAQVMQQMSEASRHATPPTRNEIPAGEITFPAGAIPAPPGPFSAPLPGGKKQPPKATIKDAPVTTRARSTTKPGQVPAEMDPAIVSQANNSSCASLTNAEEKQFCQRMSVAAPPQIDCTKIGIKGAQAGCEWQVAAFMACRASRTAAELESCNQTQRALRMQQLRASSPSPATTSQP